MNRIDEIKCDRLKDLVRRVMANPDRFDEVVAAIAVDWFPLFVVSSSGGVRVDVPRAELERKSNG